MRLHSVFVMLGCAAWALCLGACRGDDESVAASTSAGVGGAGGAAGGGGMAVVPGSPDATIMSWNLETYPLTNETQAGVVEQLQILAPDVVALQEIQSEAAFQELVAALPDYDGLLNQDPGAFLRVGMLYRTARVTISDARTLFSTQWYEFPRPPLSAQVRIEASEPFDFRILVLHLKARLDDESQDRRRRACVALDNWVRAEQAAGEEQDFVLVGDFNDELLDPPQWNVFTPFLDDPAQYSFLSMPLAEADEHTFLPFQSMIDHVLVTSDALTEYGDGETRALMLEQTVAGYEMTISDHRPVLATFRF
jgi:endonuclease/exonuclease/phosphatase family metal-dependent hydrolase